MAASNIPQDIMDEFNDVFESIRILKDKVKELEGRENKTNYEKFNDAYEVLKGLRDNLVEEKRLEDAGHIVHALELIQEEQTKIQNEENN